MTLDEALESGDWPQRTPSERVQAGIAAAKLPAPDAMAVRAKYRSTVQLSSEVDEVGGTHDHGSPQQHRRHR